MNVDFCILINFTGVPKSLIDIQAALFQVMARRPSGDNPLPELVAIHFTDAYMRH